MLNPQESQYVMVFIIDEDSDMAGGYVNAG